MTSESGTGSEAPSASQSPKAYQDSTQNGNGAKHTEESSEDTNPPVSSIQLKGGLISESFFTLAQNSEIRYQKSLS